MKKKGTNGGYIPVVSGYGISKPIHTIYEYPENHPCRGCPYTFNANVPSCIFPARADGGCFWYEIKGTLNAKIPEGGATHAKEE